ncbi:MAG TPA: hypothetical protein VE135_15545 [Pyrinomonadaceae bacterium]|nr:hypothetical protein [Pyrinomonadaceae bacterium]
MECLENQQRCKELLSYVGYSENGRAREDQKDALTASISLLFPNSFLESMWRLNPRAHENLSSLGLWAVVLMFTVSIACAAAAIGLWRTSWFGYWLAVGLIVINLIGDVTNVVLGTERKAIVGVPIATAILAYLMSRKVREFFSRSGGLN